MHDATRSTRYKQRDAVETLPDPVESAKAAGLRYVSDVKPGIRRKRCRSGFRYIGVDGAPLRDKENIGRIKSLAIPPAWTDVWICANPEWASAGNRARRQGTEAEPLPSALVQDETKYERMALFGKALPAIRERVERDLGLPGLPREKVLATIIRLMETTYIRVGNAEYARENHSYGLTTMRSRHVDVDGNTITFTFQGKSRVHHTIDVNDRRLAKIVKRCLDIPGYELFQYLDRDGEHHTIDSADVNDYLREISNQHFTAKDFRTWAGTVLASVTLREFEPFESDSQAKKNVVRAIEAVAARLGNTPSVCRKCYVHPAVLESYMSGAMLEAVKRIEEKIADAEAAVHSLREEESALLQLLEQRLALAAAS